jgi:Xaa-Pro aminopeptidase
MNTYSPNSGNDQIILRISPEEIRRRQAAVLMVMKRKGGDAFVHFNPISIFYLTGFAFAPTERPVALIQTSDGGSVFFIPQLEIDHCRESAVVDRIESYPEYPGHRHPMLILGDLLSNCGLDKANIVVDSDGYGSRWGYTGPRLREVLVGARIHPGPQIVGELRKFKSGDEIRLIKEAGRWGSHAHRLLQDAVAPGVTETEISINASRDASVDMMQTLGKDYDPKAWVPLGVMTGFRGQVGPNSANPHAMMKNLTLNEGDVLVTYTRPVVWGYYSEMERTMFVGQPSPEQEKYFHLMNSIRDIAFEHIKPGNKCSDVDTAVYAFYKKEGLLKHWRHHTGHCLGLELHEAPFLDSGDSHPILPGMVFSVEPGIFFPGLGGFRHSDTIVVTDDGFEELTHYPTDIASCACNV